MQIELTLNDGLVKELQEHYKSQDLNNIIINIIHDTLLNRSSKIEKFFGKVEYFDDYDYNYNKSRNKLYGTEN
jgi:hypothetical protein